MARPFTPKIVTANDLTEGDVVYLTAKGTWTREHAQAELFLDEAHAQLCLLDAQLQSNIVGPYLADARPSQTGPRPLHFREAFRASGPSNYVHGKQEIGDHV